MANNIVRQMLIDLHMELIRIVPPEDAVKLVKPKDGLLSSLRNNGTPIISVYPPQVNTDYFFNILRKVAGICMKHKPDTETDIKKILNVLPVDNKDKELFVAQAFTPGASTMTSFLEDVSQETFGFILSYTLKPFMMLYARKVSDFYDPETWLKGTCPVCGGKPNLALLEKEGGKRYLYCGLCEVRWRFQRLGCPYCLSNESKFFTVDGMAQYRVYYCDNCHGYIKTVNEAMFTGSDLNLFREDINTVHLDLLAMQEGYINQPV